MDWLLRSQKSGSRALEECPCLMETEHKLPSFPCWILAIFKEALEAKEKVNGGVKYIAVFVYLDKIIILQLQQKSRSKILWMSGPQGEEFKLSLDTCQSS